MTLEAKDDTTNPNRKRTKECPYCGESIAGGSAFRKHLPCDGVDE